MRNKKNIDVFIVILVFLLTGIGLVMVYSSSFVEAADRFGSHVYFLKRQIIWAVAGVILMFSIARIDYHFFVKNSTKFLIAGFILLIILLFLPDDQRVKGANRWISFRFFKIQPSEFMKFIFLWYLSYFFGKTGNITQIKRKIIVPGFIFVLIASFILLQPDLGTATVIGLSFTLILFIIGLPVNYIISIIIAGTGAFVGAIYMEPYRRNRIFAFFNPWEYRFTYGYHIINSLMAVGAGGAFGVGLGQSKQKFMYLPEPYSDFIFAVVCEEMGFVGAAALLTLFLLLFLRGWYIIRKAPDISGFILGLGIIITITIQALINMGVVLNLFPTKGLPLPFISYGGSSMLILFINIGILLNISRYRSDYQEN